MVTLNKHVYATCELFVMFQFLIFFQIELPQLTIYQPF